jgi:hypothetical protein
MERERVVGGGCESRLDTQMWSRDLLVLGIRDDGGLENNQVVDQNNKHNTSQMGKEW